MVATSTTQVMNVRRIKPVIVNVIMFSDTDLSFQKKMHSSEIPEDHLAGHLDPD